MEQSDAGSLAAIFAGLGIFFLFILTFIVFYIFCRWKIFTKGGQEGWKSLIPLYNTYIQLQITRQPDIWLLFFFIPFVNIYFGIRHIHGLSRAFGKDTGFTVGLILLPVIFYPMLAFGDSKYVYAENDPLINEINEFK